MLPTIFQASIVFGARRREASAWLAKETFSRDYSTSDSSERSLFPNPIPEEKGKEHLFAMENQVVNDVRRQMQA